MRSGREDESETRVRKSGVKSGVKVQLKLKLKLKLKFMLKLKGCPKAYQSTPHGNLWQVYLQLTPSPAQASAKG